MMDKLAQVLAAARELDLGRAAALASELAARGDVPSAGAEQGYSALHVVGALGGSHGASERRRDAAPLGAAACAVALRALVKAGLGLEARSAQLQHTPLHVAAACGASAAVEELLALGARAQAEDTAGCTPLHLAAAAGYREVVERLLASLLERDMVAVATAADKEGHTALSLAQRAGNARAAEVLQHFIALHIAGATVPEEQISHLTTWLEDTVRLPAYLHGFVSQGYTRLDLWAKLGLSGEDFDRIGVRTPAHRKQISFFLSKLATNESGDEDSDDSGESSGTESSSSD